MSLILNWKFIFLKTTMKNNLLISINSQAIRMGTFFSQNKLLI
jgi:hypothetical protein